MMSNEMKLTILTWLILVLKVFVGFTLGNQNAFVINRNRVQGDVANSRDSFIIPSPLCNPKLPSTGDECERFEADLNYNLRCSCSCPDGRATFAFRDSRWICLKNGNIRDLQDCKNKTFFYHNTNLPRRLWALKKDDVGRINIQYDRRGISGWHNCEVHLNSSWYLGYNGARRRSSLYLRKMKELFGFEVIDTSGSTGRFALKVKSGVQNSHLLQGKIINLGIRCTRVNRLSYHSCLMFKLIGQQTCPESVPSLEMSSSAKPQQTTFTPKSLVTSLKTTAFPSNISITRNIENVTVPLSPSGSLGRERSTDGSSTIGLIAGISIAGSIALFVFIIVGFLVYRRRYSHKTSNESTARIKENKQDIATINPQTNLPIPHDDENGYKALSIGAIEQQIYASSYSVPQRRDVREYYPNSVQIYAPLNIPEEHSIYGPRNSQELDPVYNVLEQPSSETGLQNGSIRLEQPVYNILEELSTAGGPEEPVYYSTEPFYNVLEGPYLENTERTSDYGAISSGTQPTEEGTEESVSQGTEPVYNVLEGPYAIEEEGFGDYGAISSEESIYKSLEEPHPDNQNGANCDTESTNDPVYHLLEENTYANT